MTFRCWRRALEAPTASVPSGPGTAAEVAKRLTLWEECRIEDLLWRAEQQLLIHRKAGKRKKGDAQPGSQTPADRARRTAPSAGIARPPRGLSRRCSLESDLRDSHTPEDTSKALDVRPGVASTCWYYLCLLVLGTLFARGLPEHLRWKVLVVVQDCLPEA